MFFWGKIPKAIGEKDHRKIYKSNRIYNSRSIKPCINELNLTILNQSRVASILFLQIVLSTKSVILKSGDIEIYITIVVVPKVLTLVTFIVF